MLDKITSTVNSSGSYLPFDLFLAELSKNESRLLQQTRVLFVYPVLEEGRFESEELPISMRLLATTLERAGCLSVTGVCSIADSGEVKGSSDEELFDHIVIHPMINLLDRLGTLLNYFRSRYPNAEISLQNSDHHQHEKLIGGPRSLETAAHLLIRFPQLDWVIRGYAEHALLSVVLKKPSSAVTGHDGIGLAAQRIFEFASLPVPDSSAGNTTETRSIRVQRARGCLSPCTYCIEGQANATSDGERPWDGLSMTAFVDRLEKLAGQGYFFINITDSSFEDPGAKGRQDVINFCHLLIERNICLSFKIHLRAENVLRYSQEDLAVMKSAGVDVIICGLESGSQQELSFFRKLASKKQGLAAFSHLEESGSFCNILGYMMFTPVTTMEILEEKVGFLRQLTRGWDFLNLTNRLLVIWGTVIHRQLIDLGLAEDGDFHAGYVPFKYKDAKVLRVDEFFNTLKRQRPEIVRLNNLMYDALNIESRLQNPINESHRAALGGGFEQFQSDLRDRERRLSQLYCNSFLEILNNPDAAFCPEIDFEEELTALDRSVNMVIEPLQLIDRHLSTVYLRTWMSSVNSLGKRT
jgi:hypothetical protein